MDNNIRSQYLQNRNKYYSGIELKNDYNRSPNEMKNKILINNTSQTELLNNTFNKNDSETLNSTNRKSQIKSINDKNKGQILNLTDSKSQNKSLNSPSNKIINQAKMLNLTNSGSLDSLYHNNYNIYRTNTKDHNNNNSQIELLKHNNNINSSNLVSLTNYNYNENKMINNNNNNNIPIRKVFTNTNSNVEKNRINDITHKENLKKIEMLKKQLNDIEKEKKFISKEINTLKNTERSQIRELNKINYDINKQQLELNKFKDINKTKNQKYIHLLNTHRQMLMDNIRNIQRDTTNEVNRQSLHHFSDRINFIYNTRRGNIENVGPSMSEEQIQALPTSFYPRNNNSDEKCIICFFPFCYNDAIIKLRNCHHIFHKACLIETLTVNRSSICPICRVSII